MARKKNRQLGPLRKRMTRQGRLSSAKTIAWVKTYGGKNIVKSYAKWFAVDLQCAMIELRILGVNITPEREAQVRATIGPRSAESQRRKKADAETDLEVLYPDSNDAFAYIAGYSSGGLPYGVTWENLGEESPWLDCEEGQEFRRHYTELEKSARTKT